MPSYKYIESSTGITDVPGFFAEGTHSDVRRKNDGRLDTAIVYSKEACSEAAVFTQNDAKAAPVLHGMDKLKSNLPTHGIVINSGNANACTGKQGKADNLEMAQLTEELCNAPAGSFYVCSTGRIGEPLPMEGLRSGIEKASVAIKAGTTNGIAAADAILTSDTRNKVCSVQFEHDDTTITVGGMAKGAGMIEPNMATMLAFVTTDANITSDLLQQSLTQAVGSSFNSISIDGDMSTNDTVIVLANGVSGVSITSLSDDLGKKFSEALDEVCYNLADKIVGDGEKITKVVELKIDGAQDDAAAERLARAVGNSLLVKTSWYGSDPNWGRLVDAAGYAKANLDVDILDIYYNDVPAMENGTPYPDKKPLWKEIVSEKRFTITINLNQANGSYRLLTTDLSEAYVDFNKSE